MPDAAKNSSPIFKVFLIALVLHLSQQRALTAYHIEYMVIEVGLTN